MGEGTTRVAELDEEITRVRGRLDALVVELDRRRHRMTNVRRLVRDHTRTAAAVGVLMVAALAVAPVVLARRRTRRTWARATAKPRPPIFGPNTLVAIGLSLAQIILPRLLMPRAERRPVTHLGIRA
jgi:hypothetical protein